MSVAQPASKPSSTAASKWLPAIETDACVGCGLCRQACPARCLEMIWDFATLVRPDDCTSCSSCARACPHDVIRMDWQACTGDHATGHWRSAPPTVIAVSPAGRARNWWKGFVRSLAKMGL